MTKVGGLNGRNKGRKKKTYSPNHSKKVGFDRIAENTKTKFEKLKGSKNISSFSLIGVPSRQGIPIYSGGMVGDPAVLLEGLFTLAKNNEPVRILVDLVSRALKENDIADKTVIIDLYETKVITEPLYKLLISFKVNNLVELARFTKDSLLEYKGVGIMTVQKLEDLLGVYNLEFSENPK